MKKLFYILIFPLVLLGNGYAQDLTPPFTTITADFGPRNVSTGSWFHRGIDYVAGLGVDINAVEGGTISDIRWWGDGGWAIFVNGRHGDWIYAHMFSGTDKNHPLPQTLENMELRNATLVNPDDETITEKKNILIFWTGISNQAYKILASRSGWWIRNEDGSYIKNNNGLVNIRTWNTVNETAGYDIGPVGNSGVCSGPHLHLSLDNQTNNPLLYVARPATGNYSIEIVSPSDADDGVRDGRIVVSNKNPIPPALQVNTITRPSLDLDKIKFYLDQLDDQHVIDSFSYGGRSGENRTPNVIDLMAVNTPISGVCPMPGGPGEDIFRNRQWNTVTMPNGQMITNGQHIVYCEAYDIRSQMARRTAIDIEINNTLTTQAIEPQPDATDVPVGSTNKGATEIKLGFNNPVDPSTVSTTTVSFDPQLTGDYAINWPNDSILVLTPTNDLHDLRYSSKYTITVTDAIRDTTGTQLDGDGDGTPGGDYHFQFTTRKPKFKFPDKTVKYGPLPESQLVKALLTTKENRLLKYKVTAHFDQPTEDWSYRLEVSEVVVDSFKTDTIKVTLIHKVSGAGEITLHLKAKAYDLDGRYLDTLLNEKIMAMAVGGPNPPGGPGSPPPGGEAGIMSPAPDDNWSVSDPNYSSPWLIDDRSQAGLLLSGYYEGMGHLLGKYNLATVPVDENLTVFSELYDELDSIRALVIPSGGLRGKEYDGNFWQKLNSYVYNGGNLVVMDQPFGSLYSRLPGNPQARGWEEDLSCTGWFTRLASGHPASSGQRWIMNSFQTDGYFTWLPEQSQIITRRQLRGGAASTAVYPYGMGKVTLTTCYTDFGQGRGQWHLEGGHLIRDLVRCGLNPDILIENI